MIELQSLKRGDELQLEITDAAFEGKAIAHYEGFVVFVEDAVPGDIVIAQLQKVKKSFAEAKVIKVERPSTLRVNPRCKYFGVCGGCRWQHVEYHTQLQFKQQHVVDSFRRIGGFSDFNILRIIGANDIYFYRGKMEYSFADQEWQWPAIKEHSNMEFPTSGLQPSIFLGLHISQRYDKVLDIDECHLQSSVSNRILNFTREFARQHKLDVYNSDQDEGYLRFLVIRESKKTKEFMVNLVTFDDHPDIMKQYTAKLRASIEQVTTVVNTINALRAQIAFGQEEKVYFGRGWIQERLGDYRFTISANSFFQTNVTQAEKLFEVVREFGEFKSDDVVYDLYSGTGSIAIFISNTVKVVIGIESVESAIRDANRNISENNITNCLFVLGDLKDCLTKDKTWMSQYLKPSAMIIDPPRSGMHPKVIDEILTIGPKRIVYVSCNPTTQARDVKMLCAEKYHLMRLQPVDMFPHTFHVENVALLHLR